MGVLLPATVPLPHDVRDALAMRADRLLGFASRVDWYDRVPSTNDLADRAAAAGAGHGFVVAAEAQSSGRGRQGHVWFSPSGAGLYVSVVLRPTALSPGGDDHPATLSRTGRGFCPAVMASSITLTAGVALAEALRAATGLPVDIKWPNDLVIGPRKVCGILAEAAAAGDRLEHVVLGFGINVLPVAYPQDIAGRATSLETELGRPADRALVLAESLARLAECLRELVERGFDGLLDRWRLLSPSSTGTQVHVLAAGEWEPAVTSGVDDDGALLVRRGTAVQRVVAGEIGWPSPRG
ncbi:MAG TPA: biotin--[acetyl-CoA-carboxylase] ligase [Vicinamibacterales bacterium]